MILELLTVGIIVGSYIYHRLTEEDPPPPRDRIQIPKIEEGDVVPILYGKVRVRQPIVAFASNATATQRISQPDGLYVYTIDVLHVLGIPFTDGTTKLEGIFFGDKKGNILFFIPGITPAPFSPNLGGLPGQAEQVGVSSDSPSFVTIGVEYGDGRSTQTFVGSTCAARMVVAGVPSTQVPGFRGYATVFMYQIAANSPLLPSVSWELSTYPDPLLVTSLAGIKIGDECNPVHVLTDLISRFSSAHGQLGKLGGSALIIDSSSFLAAARTLQDEQHGYSRVIDRGGSADSVIQEILRQIDAVLYDDQRTGTLKLKLIRPDYNPATIPQLNPSNCQGLLDFAAAGWTNVVNKIRVVFTDRSRNYLDGSSTAHNQANAVGQDGEVNEIVLHYPGVCTQELADAICARELAARSRPLAKFRAIVDRTFYRVNQGDAISVTWPDANISNMVFRVANVSQGTSDSNILAIDLIQDFFFVHRKRLDTGVTTGSFSGMNVRLIG